MGREVRRVPGDWLHPTKFNGHYVPLYAGHEYDNAAKRWLEQLQEMGLQGVLDYSGNPPNRENYMPVWTEAEADHLMMYEDTTEGTPISPAFRTAEELAHWLADNSASAFADMPATYKQWLRTIQRGSAVTAVLYDGVIRSGVAMSEDWEKKP